MLTRSRQPVRSTSVLDMGITLQSGPDAFDVLCYRGSQLNRKPLELFALRLNQLLRQNTDAIF